MTSRFSRSTARAWLGLLAVTLLAGCAGAPRWGSWSRHPSSEELAATRPPPVQRVQGRDFAAGSPQR